MEREANYAAVGAFVVLVTLLGGLFVYWYSDARDRRDYTRYEMYFDGSVSGLSRGAPVRYLGVDVGRVVDMRIDRRDSSRVQVIVDIDSSAPVSKKTIAELSLQGVTGVLFVDLIENAGSRSLTKEVPSERYPVIRSARSRFDVFLSSLPDLVASAEDVAERVTRILSDDNIEAIASTLKHLDAASSEAPATLQDVRTLLADMQSTSTEIRAMTASVRDVVETSKPEVQATLQRTRAMADNLANVSAKLEQLVAQNSRDLRTFTRDGLPELERFLREGRLAAREVRELSRSLRENPSQLIYKTPEPGVEIPP